MNIKVIGSGSSGNCYRIDDGKTALLLEAGLPIKKIKEGCDFNLSSIAGCLITHEHGDHASAVKDLIKAGIDVYMSPGTAAVLCVETLHRLREFLSLAVNNKGLTEYEPREIGTFYVLPFTVHHDAAEPVGYLLTSIATGERVLFMTDTYYTDYTFSGLTHIILEANYSAETLTDDPRAHRLRRSHMSIENCIEMLKANDLSRVQEIWLIHLSSSNGDSEEFKRKVQEATGCPVCIA